MVKAEVKSGIEFKTKTGQTVAFNQKAGAAGKTKKICDLELRLKIIEKSFANAEKEKLKIQAKAAKQAEKDAERMAKLKKPKEVKKQTKTPLVKVEQ